jgi:hypothetical protein
MIRLASLLAAVGLLVPLAAGAASLEQSLLKLDPEFRAHQACVIKGLDVVHRDARLQTADRIKTPILSRAVLDGTTLTTKGGSSPRKPPLVCPQLQLPPHPRLTESHRILLRARQRDSQGRLGKAWALAVMAQARPG